MPDCSSVTEPPCGGRIESLPLGEEDSLTLLLVTTGEPSGFEEVDADPVAAAVIGWVNAEAEPMPPIVIPLYGILVVWTPRRAALVADVVRMPVVRDAALSFSRRQAELVRIEREAESLLGTTGDDCRFGFSFSANDLAHVERLAARHRRAVIAQIALANISSEIRRPPPHPPTLAGQVGERLRDRLRLTERLESAEGKLEIAEQVYTSCGQRSSEFLIGRRQMALEWIIILLLAAETLLLVVDLLSSTSAPGGTT